MFAAEAAVAMRDSSSGLICFRVVTAAVLEVVFERLLALATMAGMVVVLLTDQSSVNTVDCYCYLLLLLF